MRHVKNVYKIGPVVEKQFENDKFNTHRYNVHVDMMDKHIGSTPIC